MIAFFLIISVSFIMSNMSESASIDRSIIYGIKSIQGYYFIPRLINARLAPTKTRLKIEYEKCSKPEDLYAIVQLPINGYRIGKLWRAWQSGHKGITWDETLLDFVISDIESELTWRESSMAEWSKMIRP